MDLTLNEPMFIALIILAILVALFLILAAIALIWEWMKKRQRLEILPDDDVIIAEIKRDFSKEDALFIFRIGEKATRLFEERQEREQKEREEREQLAKREKPED